MLTIASLDGLPLDSEKPVCYYIDESETSLILYMIEIITTSMFVISSIYGAPTAYADTIVSTTTAPGVTVKKEEIIIDNKLPTRKELEQKAKVYFKDYPILVEIARCESEFRQYDSKGNVLKGRVNKSDLGLMQINNYYHGVKSDELGFDIETVEGNMAYAKYLYEKEGSKPWNSSSKCWKEGADAILNGQVALK